MNHFTRIAATRTSATRIVSAVLIAGLVAWGGTAQAQSDPPGQAGRLAFIDGSVSFHDDQESGWSRAIVNTPLTSGDAIWTEPDSRSEISVAGSRVRLEGGTQLDLLDIDDTQTRLQIDRGRIDIKAYSFEPRVVYRIVTPRGIILLQQQGDYYVEAGSIEDATRLGVRSGVAQFQALNGQRLALRAGEVGEIDGTLDVPRMRIVKSAPPQPAPYWAARDREIDYTLPAQYLSAGVTGYEDLNAYGSWSNDSRYGHVWSPRSVPSDWQPYRTGHWSYVRPWGWTWIDDQPWGYAPYHYGRWANSNGRWVWVPPQREVKPVYAPALVAFIGGIELALSLGNANDGPVGWFPLGPRETYVPPYTANRDYYNRINRSAQIQQSELDDRWQRTQRHEPPAAGPANARMNQRFATVVPAQAFVRSQPVARAVLKIAPEKIAAAPVALVSAPPAPAASLATPARAQAPTPTPAPSPNPTPAPAPATSPAPAPAPATSPATSPASPPAPKSQPEAKAAPKPDVPAKPGPHVDVPVSKTPVTDMPTLGKPAPAPDKPAAPGPKITTVTPAPAGAANPQGRPAAPPLTPRTGSAPPQLHDDKDKSVQPGGRPDAKTPKPNEPPRAGTQPAPAPSPASPVSPTEPKPQPTSPPSDRGQNDRERGAGNSMPSPAPSAPPPAPRAAAPGSPPQQQPAAPAPPATTVPPPAAAGEKAEEKK